MKRKINHTTVFYKTIIYRLLIVVVQACFLERYLNRVSVGDFGAALNLSVVWNLINAALYYIYECMFSLRFDTTVQTKGFTVWLTGLPCSGKTTIAKELKKILEAKGKCVEHLDGDIVRSGGLSKDLGFKPKDRKKNLERVSFVSKLLSRNQTAVLCSFVSPYQSDRDCCRTQIGTDRFIEVYVCCTPNVCADRDVKGMWKKAKRGKIKGFTGYDAPYERPIDPEIVVHTFAETKEESADKILKYLESRNLI